MINLRVNLISVVSALIMVSGIKSLPVAEESINTNEPYKTLEIKSKISHKQTFIFFHGLEGSSKIWDQFKAQFSNALPDTKFLIPDAPKRQLGAADNRVAPSWYNIQSYTGLQKEDVAGIKEAISNVHKMIQSEIDSGIPANKIIIGGFSQGAALSLASGIRFKEQLGGVVALSGYLPLMSQTPETNNNSPIFWATGGGEQPGLSILGKLGQETLKKTGHNFELHTYPELGHDLNEREMKDVIEFAKKNFGQETPKKAGDNSEQDTYPKSGDNSEKHTYPKPAQNSEQQTLPELGNDLNKPEMEKIIEYAKNNLDQETLKKVGQNFKQQTNPELGQDLNTPEMQKVIEFAKNNLGHAK